jgi:hypothetical protein
MLGLLRDIYPDIHLYGKTFKMGFHGPDNIFMSLRFRKGCVDEREPADGVEKAGQRRRTQKWRFWYICR